MKKFIPFGGNVAFEYRGVFYCPEKDYEQDNIKISHIVRTPDAKLTYILMSPYEVLTEINFQRWVDLGMPSPQRGNLRNREIEEMWEVSYGKN